MTGRTNLDGPIQSARSMYFGETPRSEGGGGGPLFSPIGPNRSPERRSSSSARLSRNGKFFFFFFFENKVCQKCAFYLFILFYFI